jgi:UDP-2-acetamido-2,6-beta-L-arabino-hexul-4-ose reductase
MRVAVTGAEGFLGWHLRCALLADGRHEVVPVGRAEFADAGRLAAALAPCDAVVHLAGANRGSDREVEEGNRQAAIGLAAALAGSAVRTVVHGNSIHCGADTAFGRGKAFATGHLAAAVQRAGGNYTDVVLPNVFGEGGRPHYNSFVATFCHELVAGREPRVHEDRELQLLAAQDAADVLIHALDGGGGVVRPDGRRTSVGAVLALLRSMRGYATTGEFPDLSDPFRVAMFHTFQSFCFPARYPMDAAVHSDARGTLFESARAQRTDTLSFVSTTVPGAVRGQHFHRRKVERFLVVDGTAEIRLRRVCGLEEVSFSVSGDRPQSVDMPPLWAHSIKNTGDSTLTTVFWSNELLDPAHPDTYRFPVHPDAEPCTG